MAKTGPTPAPRNGFAHDVVHRDLLAQIRRGRSGERLPAIAELQRTYGVSLTTVNRALVKLEHQGLIRRHAGKGIFIAAPEARVQTEGGGLGAAGGPSVIFASPQYFSHRLFRLGECASLEAGLHHLELQAIHIRPDTKYEILIEAIKGPQVQGLILAPPAGPMPLIYLRALRGIGKPVVLLEGRRLPEPGHPLALVAPDTRAGTRLAMEHLLGYGHRRIAYVPCEPEDDGTQARYGELSEIFKAHPLPPEGLEKRGDRPKAWESSMVAGHRLAAAALEKGSFTALLFDSAMGALGGLKAIHQKGLKVPGDISVIADGFEGDAPVFDFTQPALSAISFPCERIILEAFRVVTGQSPNGTLLAPLLLKRETVGPAPR